MNEKGYFTAQPRQALDRQLNAANGAEIAGGSVIDVLFPQAVRAQAGKGATRHCSGLNTPENG